MAQIGLFYGSDGGATKDVCDKLVEQLGSDNVEMFDVADASKDNFAEYGSIILASSTWGDGELQSDWEEFIDELDDVDFSGKKVALLGLGDQDGYGDTFCDALGIIHEKLEGAVIVGETSTDGYDFDDSKAVVDGKFIGLCIDEDNQDDLTDERISAWSEQIRSELGV